MAGCLGMCLEAHVWCNYFCSCPNTDVKQRKAYRFTSNCIPGFVWLKCRGRTLLLELEAHQALEALLRGLLLLGYCAARPGCALCWALASLCLSQLGRSLDGTAGRRERCESPHPGGISPAQSRGGARSSPTAGLIRNWAEQVTAASHRPQHMKPVAQRSPVLASAVYLIPEERGGDAGCRCEAARGPEKVAGSLLSASRMGPCPLGAAWASPPPDLRSPTQQGGVHQSALSITEAPLPVLQCTHFGLDTSNLLKATQT